MTPGVPVVDIGALRTGSDAERRRIAHEIGEAARRVGFLCIAGHGIPAALLAETFDRARAFFALPAAEKERVASHGAYRGFTGAASLVNGDRHESYDLGIELPPTAVDAFGDRPLVTGNRWPDLPGFRETLLACFAESFAVFEVLHRAIALDLGADPEFFTPLFGRNYGMRLSYYPTVADPQAAFGAGPHTDFGNLTLLAEDGPGLELQGHDGAWFPITASPEALVCNIGDCLMRWSNDTYVSTRHRVLNPTVRDRISIGFFANADLDVIVDPLPSCTSAERPARYAPIEFGDYMQERFSSGYVKAETRG
jgi:isopenicillin N synthase-like dioxygenase